MDPPTTKEKQVSEKQQQKFLRMWLWVFVVLIAGFITAIAVIIHVSIKQQEEALPDHIDAVIIDRGRGRVKYQIKSIQQHMDFIDQIFVLMKNPTEDDTDQVKYVNFDVDENDLGSAYMYMDNLPGVNEHVIFFGDYTFPFRKIYKPYMFFGERPRLFNIFRDASEETFFKDYLDDTLPTFVQSKDTLAECSTWQDVLFREVTEESVVLKSDMNKDVFINSTLKANADRQFDYLDKLPPVFATIHISGNEDTANEWVVAFLNKQFS